MRKPLIGARDFEAFIGQGEQAQGHRGLPRERVLCVCGKKKKNDEV
jgi:hypothetical protein